jgi:hypothetical protein
MEVPRCVCLLPILPCGARRGITGVDIPGVGNHELQLRRGRESDTMPSLIRVILSSIVISLCAAHSGCGWQKQLVFSGPDNAVMNIRQPWPANGWGLQLQLCQKGMCEVVYSLRGDVFLHFAEVYWSDDATKVGVVTCSEPYLRFAYDRIHRTEIPFTQLAEPMRAQMRRAYSLDASADPLLWACSDDATSRFAKAHPGFRQR